MTVGVKAFNKDDRDKLLGKSERVGPQRFDKAQKMNQLFTGMNRKFEEDEAQRKANEWGMPYFDLTGFPIEHEALEMVPEDRAREAQALVFYKEGASLKLAFVDPQNDIMNQIEQELKSRKYEVEVYVVSHSAFEQALAQYKKIVKAKVVDRDKIIVQTGKEVLDNLDKLSKKGERISEVSMTKMMSLLFGAGITMRASDIHLEPEKEFLKVRFRVDGVLQDILHLPMQILRPLISRIKLLSRLKLNITTTPQDGRFTVQLDKQEIEIRVSILPTSFGESVVMRILGMGGVNLDINELGFQGRAMDLILQELRKPNGMILTTGPTGSGKTTTLYSFLNHLNEPGVKIITLEDPVEYKLEGITQTPIDHSAGMDFAKGLRAILRQDPDVVMVGEIRDQETAETAAQAALTGHVVLSTLHTNDAAGAIPRFLDLGVKPVTLAPALNALIAQRLLRKICEACRENYQPSDKEIQLVKMSLEHIPKNAGIEVPTNLRFYHSKGCAECHDLGYKGRIGVIEVFAVDQTIEPLIFKQASTMEIKQAAIAQGMVTMQQDGILKALQGVTDLAEVWRVTEE